MQLELVLKDAVIVEWAAPPSLTLPRPSAEADIRRLGGEDRSEFVRNAVRNPSPLEGEGRGGGCFHYCQHKIHSGAA